MRALQVKPGQSGGKPRKKRNGNNYGKTQELVFFYDDGKRHAEINKKRVP
jgi:hypothetical protein